MNEAIYDFFVTTALEMEELCVAELSRLGALDIKKVRAGVQCRGNLAFGYKACLYSRIANRVLLVLKTIDADDAEELYEGVATIPWSDHLGPQQTLVVDFLMTKAAHNRNIIHTQFGAQKVKDAIVDQQRRQFGARSSVDSVHPDVRVNVFLSDRTAIVSIDLSGDSLHRRGYRAEGTMAPLKENLAAAILAISEWPREGYNLVDPMCGSGTILIEAGLMAKRVAPGLLRNQFGFSHWRGHVPQLWQDLRKEAEEQIYRGRKKLPVIVGSDHDQEAIQIAQSNIQKAGMSDFIRVERRDVSSAQAIGDKGLLVTNPPYGERLGDRESLQSLYQQLGDIMKNRFKGWEGYIITGNPELAKSIGLKASRRYVLYNGAIECRLLKYELY